jgi:hypothetical protein
MNFEGFIGGAYRSRSEQENAQQTINYYLEMDKSGKFPIALYGTPGTVSRLTLAAAASVRGAFEYDGIAYFVCGNKFYSVTSAYVATEEGTLTTSTGFVSICTNGLVVLIVDGTEGYTYTIATSTFATIADVDFPPNPLRCDVLRSTFVVIEGGAQRFWISVDGTTWDSADFASAETKPDNLLSVIESNNELLLGGVDSMEFWYYSGDTFAFSLRSTSDKGIAGAGAICKGDNSIYFLAKDKSVWRINGYTPVRISTHPVEYAIGQLSTVSDCVMWCQIEEGHTFIWCQFPTGNETWVYDVASGEWHRRAWRDTSDGSLNRHRANCYVLFNGKHLVGDYENGKIYELDLGTYDDDGEILPAIRVCRHITGGSRNQTVCHDSLVINTEQGVGLPTGQGSDPQMMLKWSDNGGKTWGSEVWRSIGATGEYSAAAEWHRLGSVLPPASRVYWCEITDPVKRVLLGAYLETS